MAQRFKEKISVSKFSLQKNKKIIWIHAASIGETKSVFPLISKLTKDNEDIFILLTSTTLSAGQLIERQKFNKNLYEMCFNPRV